MEEEYDYSMYTTVCTITICPVANKLKIHQFSNRISEASSRYAPFQCLQVPLKFYYNKESGNVIYGDLMIYHYKQHPPHEKYVHVSNFVGDLYTLFQLSCEEGSNNQRGEELRSAITLFLTKIYPAELSSKGEASTTQSLFILPSHEYTNKTFIDEHFRPLLGTTPWYTIGDPYSKIVFSKSIDSLGYLLNGSPLPWCQLKLQREKKYLFCNLKKVYGQDQVLLSANFIRAVYDPDLIAASGRSMSALGGEALLWPKLVAPTLTVKIPVTPAIEGIDNLVSFLYMKVFVDGDSKSKHEELEDYKTDRNHKSLMHHLIRSISDSNRRDEWTRKIEVNHFPDYQWCYRLSDDNKKKLSQITYLDVLQFFDNFNITSLESEIMQYLQEHNDEESFQSIVTFDLIETTTNSTYPEKHLHHNTVNFDFTNDCGNQFYLLKIQHSISGILKGFRRSNYTNFISVSEYTLMEGHALKTLKMVQLSNELGRPIVMKPSGKAKKASRKTPAIQKEKLTLIEQIQPYGYYVEANITCTNEIKMSLNQVIETSAKDGKLQKSTMSILDSLYQTSDMYTFIFDALWNIIDGHLIDPQCKSLQEDGPTPLDRYNVIRADLINAIKNNIENKSNAFQDLDEVVYHYNAEPSCTCDLSITHRFVMNTGVLPYLKSIACEMIASLKSNAEFGNYRISCLHITGEFLCKWLEQGYSTYGELIWNQLQEAISVELYNKQLRVHLMMLKSAVLDDKALDYKPFKLEKYTQVFNKQYYLRISPGRVKNLQVYHDKGDHCVKVPITKQDEDDNSIWEIPISPTRSSGDLKNLLAEKFYIVFHPEDVDQLYCKIRLIPLSLADLDSIDTALSSKLNVALMSDLFPFESSAEAKAIKARCTFPLEVKITPCSYLPAIDLRMRMGIDASARDPLEYYHVAYSERLTFQKI